MSLTLAIYNAQHLVVAGDHGTWKIRDGVAHSPRFDPQSKIIEVPGLSVVVGYVGTDLRWSTEPDASGNLEFLHTWALETDFGADWSIESIARRVWDALMERHRPKAEMILGPLSGELTEEQRIRVGLNVFVAGFNRGARSPELWAGNYPDREPHVINVVRYGAATFHSTGMYAVGCNDGLQKDFGPKGIYRPSPAYNHFSEENFVELARNACAAAEEHEHNQEMQRVIGPFDLVVVRPGGVEWLERATSPRPGERYKGPIPAPRSGIAVACGGGATTVASHIQGSTAFNALVPNMPPLTTNAVFHYSSPSSSEIDVWIDAGSDATQPTFYFPDGSTLTAAYMNTSTSPYKFTGLQSGSYAFLAYYSPSTSTWHVTYAGPNPPSPPFSAAQEIAAYQDGIVAFITNSSTKAVTTNSGGGNYGGCPAVGQVIETEERGFVKAETLQRGEHLRDWTGDWNEILVAPCVSDAEIWEVVFDTEAVRVDASHLFDLTGKGDWLNVKELQPGMTLQRYPEGVLTVGRVSCLGPGQFVHITCERSRYVLGRTVSHNVKAL